ncbi:MAG: diguanylate cyclase [Xanthomonadaceae bacterium]|nr:diguanylate cyclase [Xanthomonadaceae bacterium]MDE2246261.1 diguanylate cyclase [Xanthomonadaceae bacterium]
MPIQRRRAVRGLLLSLLMLLSLPACGTPAPAPTGDCGKLQAAWLSPAPGQSPATIRSGTAIGTLHAFDTRRLWQPPRNPDGVWVRLLPACGRWLPAPRVLVIRTPGLGVIRLLPAQGPAMHDALEDSDRGRWHAAGMVAFPLQVMPAGADPLWLHFEPTRALGSPVTLHLLDGPAFQRTQLRWVAYVSAALAILVGMALTALCFAVLLRDGAYLLYAGYVGSYALLQALASGYLFQPLGLGWAVPDPVALGRVAGALSGLFSILFAWRLIDLPRRMPRLAPLALLAAALFLLIAACAVVPLHAVQALAGHLQNPVVLFAGPTLLILCLLALLRGSRYAGFFLAGWLPLVLLTVIASAQQFGVLRDWTWLDPATLGAAAFEALILSAALADKTLAARHEHRQLRLLAETDALTAVFNRRTLLDRLQSLMAEAVVARQPLALLFLDIDHFKALNDRHGHRIGDDALTAIAHTLRQILRDDGIIGRYGGEEFLIVLPGRDGTQAQAIAEQLRLAIAARGIGGTGSRSLTVSIGVATRRDGDSADTLIERADQAMYAAKAGGRNRIATGAPTP